MANSKSKTQQKKDQTDEPQAVEFDQGDESNKVDWSSLEAGGSEQSEADKSQTKKKQDDEDNSVVSFQDLDEPDENLPGIVAPKKEN